MWVFSVFAGFFAIDVALLLIVARFPETTPPEPSAVEMKVDERQGARDIDLANYSR